MCLNFLVSNRSFRDNQNHIEISNNSRKDEKSLRKDVVKVSRVDINILKSKLQENQNKDFKKNLIFTSLLILGMISLGIFLSF